MIDFDKEIEDIIAASDNLKEIKITSLSQWDLRLINASV